MSPRGHYYRERNWRILAALEAGEDVVKIARRERVTVRRIRDIFRGLRGSPSPLMQELRKQRRRAAKQKGGGA